MESTEPEYLDAESANRIVGGIFLALFLLTLGLPVVFDGRLLMYFIRIFGG